MNETRVKKYRWLQLSQITFELCFHTLSNVDYSCSIYFSFEGYITNAGKLWARCNFSAVIDHAIYDRVSVMKDRWQNYGSFTQLHRNWKFKRTTSPCKNTEHTSCLLFYPFCNETTKDFAQLSQSTSNSVRKEMNIIILVLTLSNVDCTILLRIH